MEVKNVPGWIFYKNKKDDVKVSFAKGLGRDKGNAIRLSGKKAASIHTNVKVRQGKVYVVRAVSKKTGKAGGILRIQWKNEKGKWHNHAMIIAAPYNEDLSDGWKRATLFVREIPEKSHYLCPLLTYTGTGEKDHILIDKVEVFSLFEEDGKVAPHLRDVMEKWQKMRNSEKKNKILKENMKVSIPDKEERIPKGVFPGKNIVTDEEPLPGNIFLCKSDFQCGSGKNPAGKFFKAVGKNAGFNDDTSGVIKDGNGYILFRVNKVREGEKYEVKTKIRKTGGNVVARVQYSSSKVKAAYDYSKGIPSLKNRKDLGNGWVEYSTSITIPSDVHNFSIVISTRGMKKGDILFVDDVSAKKIK